VSPAGPATPDNRTFYATSTIGALKLIVLSRLPEESRIVGREIYNCVANLSSEGGKRVKAHGWPVTAEAPMERFEAVSFAAQFEDVYGGPYSEMRGKVAIFKGPRLIAVVYGAKASDWTVGSVEALEGGSVRLWDGARRTIRWETSRESLPWHRQSSTDCLLHQAYFDEHCSKFFLHHKATRFNVYERCSKES
jgi:hypothetical protein